MLYTYWIYAVFIFIIDRILKRFALAIPDEWIDILGGFVRLKYSENPGIAFWIPLEWIPLKIITTILLIVLLYAIYLANKAWKRWETFGLFTIFSWAFANAYDRYFTGYVIDYLSVKYFAICNLADIVITTWMIIFLFYSYYGQRK